MKKAACCMRCYCLDLSGRVPWAFPLTRAGASDPKSKMLGDNNSAVRAEAAGKLARMGPAARVAIPALIEALMRKEPGGDPYLPAKSAAADALVNIGPAAVPPLLEALRDENRRDQGWGNAPPAGGWLNMPPLFHALREIRSRGDAESKQVETALNELIKHHDCQKVRLWAGEALGVLKLESGKPVPYPETPSPSERKPIAYWVANLKHEDSYVRAWAAHILADKLLRSCSPTVKKHFRALAEALSDNDHTVRLHSADALRRITQQARGEAKEVVPALIQAIQEVDKSVSTSCRYLLYSLQHIGPEATAAIPVLSEILENKENDRLIRVDVAQVLGSIGHIDGVSALLESLDDPEERVCVATVKALGEIGSNAKEAVPKLIELLDSERIYRWSYSGESRSISVRETAAEALRKIDPEAAVQTGVP